MKRPDFFDYDSITDYRIDLNNYCDYLEKNNKELIESVEEYITLFDKDLLEDGGYRRQLMINARQLFNKPQCLHLAAYVDDDNFNRCQKCNKIVD